MCGQVNLSGGSGTYEHVIIELVGCIWSHRGLRFRLRLDWAGQQLDPQPLKALLKRLLHPRQRHSTSVRISHRAPGVTVDNETAFRTLSRITYL